MRRKLFDIICVMTNRMSNRLDMSNRIQPVILGDMIVVGRIQNMLHRELLDT